MQSFDIVIAWVDGNDMVLKQKRQKYLTGKDALGAVGDTRFANNHEIYFNIASILKYVPFCRTIFIVTDNQAPEFLNEFAAQGLCSAEKIRIVDHREIFAGYEEYLPTFNSLSIESMLWNIKGLSDFFVYLNDDFFFNAPACLEDFFRAEKIVTHGHWQSAYPVRMKCALRQCINNIFARPHQPKHTVSQMLGAEMLGMNKFFNIHHHPHSVDGKLLGAYLQQHADVLRKQIRHRFRSIEQFNPVSLITHLKVQAGEAVLEPDIDLAYLKNDKGVDGFLHSIVRNDIKYGCIQSLDTLSYANGLKIKKAMCEKFQEYLPSSVLNLAHEN